MSSRSIRLVCLIVVLCSVMSILTGCAGVDQSATPSATAAPSVTVATTATDSTTSDATATTSTEKTRTVVDMKGRTVQIPENLDRIASLSPYITYSVVVLGAGDKLVAVDSSCLNNANLAKVYPDIVNKIDVGYDKSVNLESVLQSHPQVVLALSWTKDIDKIESTLNTPVVCVNMDDSRASTEFLGEVVGNQAKAKEFVDYYDAKMALINQKVDDVAKKPTVYIAAGFKGGAGLQVTWTKSSTWAIDIDAAGGVYVADLPGGGTAEVGQEQLLNWNPDQIILDQSCVDSKSAVLADAKWESLGAVQNNMVVRGPNGYIDAFGRPHIESILSRLWLADKFYPGQMGIDMVSEAKDFYTKFYGVNLTDAEVEKLVNPQN